MRKVVTLFLTAMTTGVGAAVVCGIEAPKAVASQKVNAAIARPVLTKLPDLKAGKVFIATYVPPETLGQYQPITWPVQVGQKIYLVCPFTNATTVAVSGSWKVGYFIDGKQVYSQDYGAIEGNGSRNPAGWWVGAGVGWHTYTCSLDYENAIHEMNEMNNKASVRFQVMPALPPPVHK